MVTLGIVKSLDAKGAVVSLGGDIPEVLARRFPARAARPVELQRRAGCDAGADAGDFNQVAVAWTSRTVMSTITSGDVT